MSGQFDGGSSSAIVDEANQVEQNGTAFEVMLEPTEIEFVMKQMPKGYCVTTNFKTVRARPTKLVSVF